MSSNNNIACDPFMSYDVTADKVVSVAPEVIDNNSKHLTTLPFRNMQNTNSVFAEGKHSMANSNSGSGSSPAYSSASTFPMIWSLTFASERGLSYCLGVRGLSCGLLCQRVGLT